MNSPALCQNTRSVIKSNKCRKIFDVYVSPLPAILVKQPVTCYSYFQCFSSFFSQHLLRYHGNLNVTYFLWRRATEDCSCIPIHLTTIYQNILTLPEVSLKFIYHQWQEINNKLVHWNTPDHTKYPTPQHPKGPQSRFMFCCKKSCNGGLLCLPLFTQNNC